MLDMRVLCAIATSTKKSMRTAHYTASCLESRVIADLEDLEMDPWPLLRELRYRTCALPDEDEDFSRCFGETLREC